ncbi:hypothetical protein SI65_05996 [Aspergillus cristatus]|uniref:Protein kinase domain-containing protein n=1 Tax=Aspergillus cristatus TaxID=573508 RepID=A0A1E3BAY6_ASPCR|nr:hypothetical protein SI65_05996 [Aspergillus cristatus]
MSFPLTPPPDTGKEPIDTPIYLIPLSKSARFSFQLQANQKRLAPSTIPSHISDLEDLGPVWRAGVSNALRLAPRLETTSYTLGSDNNSDIVVQTKTEDECWVNSQHCQLIPDPDRATITVSNTSTTTFTVQNMDERDPELEISPKQSISISQRKWYLTLGRGLKILVIVLPPDPDIHQRPLIQSRSSKKPARPRSNDKTAPSSTPKKTPGRKKGRNVRSRNCQGHKAREPVVFTRKINLPIPTRGESSRREEIITSTDRTRVFKFQHYGTVVAAKESRNAGSNSAAEVWENEKAILEHLKGHQHQYITNLINYDEPLRILYLDYIAGMDLEKRITPSGFSMTTEDQKHIIWTDISSALEFLHREGVIHNDVKPPNIILSEEKAVLCDFGLATMGPQEHYWGTAPYVSPDILVDEKRSESGDIWALGVTMLFVIGLIPLPKRDWNIKDITNSESRALFSMNRWLQEIRRTCVRIPEKFSLLRRMLTESREERITATQLSESLTHRSHLKVR